jgi:predicted small lipoprotein YifL
MVAAIREPFVTSTSALRFAAIGLIVLSFLLTACGRRGPLDPPPRPSAAPASDQQQVQSGEPTEDEFGNPAAPRGQKKSFPLDVLLN